MRPLLVARQPIYDERLDIWAYELLFWQQGAVEIGQVEGDEATTSVVLSAFAEGQIDTILGPHLGFVNITENLLRGWAVRALPRERVVLEILEDIQVDEALLDVVHSLARDGYRIALDDFTWRDDLEPLVALADYVKLDVVALGRDGLAEAVARLRPYHAALIAEKIETHEDFAYARSLGIHLFQGYFLCRPAVLEGRAASTRRGSVLQLLARAHDRFVSREALARIVETDVPLCYRLLRIVNSPLYGRSKRVESISHALEHLGDADRLWIPLLALGGIDEKPVALFDTAARRARMCSALARSTGEGDAAAFLAGLYSVADALLDRPLAEILEALDPGPDVVDAVLHHRGAAGEALACVLAQEDARFEAVGFRELEPAEIQRAYLEGIIWAAQVRRYTEH